MVWWFGGLWVSHFRVEVLVSNLSSLGLGVVGFAGFREFLGSGFMVYWVTEVFRTED